MSLPRFQYGAWQAQQDSVSFNTIQQILIPAANGKPTLRRITWDIRGKIVHENNANPQSDVMGKVQEASAAFNRNYQDVGFPGTPFFFQNASTFGGVVVIKPFSFNDVKGADGVTYFNWSAAIEAHYKFSEFTEGTVLDFRETTSFSNNGGFPIYAERLPVNGSPILQQVSSGSWYYGTQQGTIEVSGGLNAEPLPPLFPGALRYSTGKPRTFEYQSPKMLRGQPVSCVTTWAYEYISSVPFFASPNVRT